jgi:hypothetical protein
MSSPADQGGDAEFHPLCVCWVGAMIVAAMIKAAEMATPHRCVLTRSMRVFVRELPLRSSFCVDSTIQFSFLMTV